MTTPETTVEVAKKARRWPNLARVLSLAIVATMQLAMLVCGVALLVIGMMQGVVSGAWQTSVGLLLLLILRVDDLVSRMVRIACLREQREALCKGQLWSDGVHVRAIFRTGPSIITFHQWGVGEESPRIDASSRRFETNEEFVTWVAGGGVLVSVFERKELTHD